MFKVNAAKELKSLAKDQRKELKQDAILIEAQKLLDYGGAQDTAILRAMGLNSNIVKLEEIKGRAIELEALETKYNQIFTIGEIKTLACKYALRFLRTDDYKGAIDPTCLQKIREFTKVSGIELNNTDYQYKFFILAPAKAFALEERPRPMPDPIMFYKIDEGHYRLIHKWGKDFTYWRAFLGYYNSSENCKYFSRICIISTLIFILANSLTGSTHILINIIASIGLGCLIGAVSMISDDRYYPWSELWNSKFKS